MMTTDGNNPMTDVERERFRAMADLANRLIYAFRGEGEWLYSFDPPMARLCYIFGPRPRLWGERAA